LPVLLDRDLRVPPSARVFGAGRRPLIVCGEGAIDPALPADLLRVRAGPGGLDLDELMRGLLARGVHNLLVEGGGAVHRSFLSAGLVDRVHLFLSPKLLVGGPGWLGGPPFALAEAPRLRFIDLHRRGDDLELVLEP
jgi:riboflavin biosynthesis pyrimidine reductase